MKRAAFDSEKSQPDDDAEEAEPKRESQRSSNTISIFDDSDDEESENSSEDDSGDTAGRINSREQLIIDKNEAIREFKKVIKKWSSYTPDWKALFPKEKFSHYEQEDGTEICDPDPFTELMQLDMGILMRSMDQYNSDNRNEFGFLPLMTRLSPCQLGALNAQSFVERMKSCN